ncbi:hypothetical protein HMPREF1210_01665 [Paenisporosarcina sp. HGH0030]|uniref:metallophosphoesterase n=1 Tax=Paenisporosarcina sp. HGH0030 TaxID=1078085 RepID=UPI00034E664B|nr:metallophosphoesterase [Paenisporosarcina sp. HGH0030]EPD52312.1 hypothetical protein HMPREF1210_01665 [Paenisporosarcina sp. HGH0030]
MKMRLITISKRILAISDIHGCLDEFKELLTLVNYDSAKDDLILLGDYMDRGRYSKDVIYFVKELVERQKAIALKGNHDQLFYDWLKDPIGKQHTYFRSGGLETIISFLGKINIDNPVDSTYEKWAKEILESNEEIVNFIEDLPYYFETEEFIFVHAGINPEYEDWKTTSEYDLVWIREPFLTVNHKFDKTIIHGHTPAIYLHEKADIYYGNKKIGIDGACVYGHQLNCLEINGGEFNQFFVVKEKHDRGEWVYQNDLNGEY